MAAPAIPIPEAMAEDPEDVVTALETAALFGARGDATEAVRWVRHAATSAGESGCDVRALDLARAAADLTPPPPSVAAPAPSLPEPPVRSSVPASASVAPARASARPPVPPSSRPAPSVAPRSAASAPTTLRSERPRAATSVAPRSSQAPRSSAAPQSSQAPRPWPASERRSVVPRAATASALPSGSEASETSSAALARDAHDAQVAAPAQETAGAAPQVEPLSGRRTAARVAVTPGTEPGLFAVRVLADGALLPKGSLEAYLVLTDQNARLTSHE